jgi:hypothetical protein
MKVTVGSIIFSCVLFLLISTGYSEDEHSVPEQKNSDYSTKIVFVRDFYIAPNPVLKPDVKCNIYLNPLKQGVAELRIYDPTGNEIMSYNNMVSRYGRNHDIPFFSWNMKNRNGRIVGTGTYLAVVTLRSEDGEVCTYRRKIGYKEE